MEDLREIVQLLTKNKTSKIEIVGADPDSDSLFNRFYNGLYYDEFTDDASAAKALYNSTAKDNRYIKLKYEFRKRLVNTVFFIGLNKTRYSDRTKAIINVQKNWSAAQILLGYGARNAGIKVAEKNIRIALKYEYTAISLDMARTLCRHYARHEYNRDKKKLYTKIINKQKKILDLEIKAEEYYLELLSEFTLKRGAYSDQLVQKAKSYSTKLKSKIGILKSKKLTYFSNRVFVLRYELEMNYKKVIEASKIAIKAFEVNRDRAGIISMKIKLIVSYITLKKFNDAKNELDTVLPNINVHNATWSTLNELYLIYCFHKKGYQEAVKIQAEVGFHKDIQKLPISSQEGWKLYAAYLHYFKAIGIVNFEEYKNIFKSFKLGKFLNDIPQGTKDKEGLNIQILIIQTIFLLRRNKIDQAIKRMQVLHQYCGKYLKKDHTYRSNVFIRMLIVLIRNQMHRAATIRKSAKYLKLLKEHPIEKSKQSIGVEVVPFEDLWELIIADTKNEFRFTSAKRKKVEELFGPKRKPIHKASSQAIS